MVRTRRVKRTICVRRHAGQLAKVSVEMGAIGVTALDGDVRERRSLPGVVSLLINKATIEWPPAEQLAEQITRAIVRPRDNR